MNPSEALSYLNYYAVVYNERAFYVFGGKGASDSKTIARLDAETTTWSKAGTLVTGRSGHGAIFDGEKFLIVGGVGSLKNEVCTPVDKTMTCVEQSITLDSYRYYPELFLVGENYGKDWNNWNLDELGKSSL